MRFKFLSTHAFRRLWFSPSLQLTFPCCEAFKHAEDWTELWTKENNTVWMHPKDFKYTHNLELCQDDPLVYPFDK